MKFKKQDTIFILVILMIAVVGYLIMLATRQPKGNYVVISIEGKVLTQLSLNKDQTYKVETEHGYNLVEIAKEKVRIKSADCSNQTCVKTGMIGKNGETIICLPHKVEVTIVADKQSEVDAVVK